MDIDPWIGFITLYEAAQIWAQLHDACEPSNMVLWSGVGFDLVESWAAHHGRKTLTQAMGPLMDKSNPICRFHVKTAKQWSRYVHAASILFAVYISTGHEVVVLTPHPPQRLNPFNTSYYQKIEEPWLTSCCDENEFKIMFAHPGIRAAKDYIYQYWPVDGVGDWTARFPGAGKMPHWENHIWDAGQQSAYHPSELRQKRSSILEKLHLYRTGASVYWPAVVSICLGQFFIFAMAHY